MALICWARWGPPDHVSDLTTLLPIRTSSLSRGTSNEDRAAKKWASPANRLFSVSTNAKASRRKAKVKKFDSRLDEPPLAVERAAHRRLRRGLRAPRRAAEASAGADVHRTPLAAHET